MSSGYAPPSATNILPAKLFQSLYFLPQPFCSSAHTFQETTRSHQAGSCHQAPSKDDDFNFSGYIFQMPEKAESEKTSHLTMAPCRQEGKFYSAPSYRSGQLFQDLFYVLWFRNIFPWIYTGKITLTFNTALRKYPKSVKQAYHYTTHSHGRLVLWFPSLGFFFPTCKETSIRT